MIQCSNSRTSVQTTLASYAWHLLVPPQGHCSRCCCPTSSSALWRYLGQGTDAALQDGQREASTIGFHTQQTNQKLFVFVRRVTVSAAELALSSRRLRARNAHKSPVCAHKHTTRVSVGLNKTGSYKSGSITVSSFSHSRQTHLVPFASLIGNESAEQGAFNC